mmetsp:Transcript_37156/g.79247  ORF Transcript_37156/g.79247 Transcript_37156/m.79247 type:complete len:231 (+) Transcript_37156:218-910(+)
MGSRRSGHRRRRPHAGQSCVRAQVGGEARRRRPVVVGPVHGTARRPVRPAHRTVRRGIAQVPPHGVHARTVGQAPLHGQVLQQPLHLPEFGDIQAGGEGGRRHRRRGRLRVRLERAGGRVRGFRRGDARRGDRRGVGDQGGHSDGGVHAAVSLAGAAARVPNESVLQAVGRGTQVLGTQHQPHPRPQSDGHGVVRQPVRLRRHRLHRRHRAQGEDRPRGPGGTGGVVGAG